MLGQEIMICGPLLTAVANGIDVLGGMMLNFKTGSRSRSKHFMKTFFILPDEVAEVLYTLFRCGAAHEGIPKLDTFFFVHYAIEDAKLLYKSPDDVLMLDVTELARRYVKAVDTIALDVHRHLQFVPVPDEGDTKAMAAALSHIQHTSLELGKKIPEDEAIQAKGSGSGPGHDWVKWWLHGRPELAKLFIQGGGR